MVSLHPETTAKHVLFSVGTVCDLHQHAASVSWRLSSGRWNVTAWHFVQQSCSSFWFSQGYCPEAAETLSWFLNDWLILFIIVTVWYIQVHIHGYTTLIPSPTGLICHYKQLVIIQSEWLLFSHKTLMYGKDTKYISTACDCLRSHHQRVMSKGRGVYIRGKHVHNRSQTACAISRKILGYVQSVPKLVTTICGEHAICHCRPCV